MRVMRAQQEQHHRHGQQELLGGRVLVAVVDLLPHVEVVVGAGVELEGHALHPVEHDVGAEHVGDVGERPGGFLADAREGVEEDFEEEDQEGVDEPGACAYKIR